MNNVKILEESINIWSEYDKTPDPIPWVKDNLMFLLLLAVKVEHKEINTITENELEKLNDLCRTGKGSGFFIGVAVHDIADNEVSNMLFKVDKIAHKLHRKIKSKI